MILTDYFAAILAFCLSTGLILGLRPVARRMGLVDVPNERKVHDGEVPLIGGIAIFCSVVVAHLVSSIISPAQPPELHYLAFYLGAAMLVLVGMIDDYRELSPLTRIVVQALAALIMVYGGGVIVSDLGTAPFFAGNLMLGAIAVPFTVFGTVGVINAVNMSDGLDGLAGSLTLVSLLGFLIATSVLGNGQEAPFLVILSASLVAFLVFNVTVSGKRKALIFLGDAGSMLLGFALAWFAISLSQSDESVIRPAAALWFLMVPIYDAVCMTARRVLRRRPAFSADKEHLHHIFLLAGFTVNETVLTMAGLAAAGVGIGIAGSYYAVPDFYLAAAFLLGGLLYFWMIVRAWSVMRFLRRSICRRRNIGDRRSYRERRRRRGSPPGSGPERRSGADRRRGTRERRVEGMRPES